MFKKLTVAVAAASAMGFSALAVSETVPSPLGDFDVSMTATLASDYIWRGQSQTAGEAAIQGSLDVAHESGLYAGIWASNVDDAAFPGNTSGADIEVDYYVGYGYGFTDDISADLQLAKYTYPQASEWNGYEIIPSITAYGFTLGYKYGVETGVHPSYTWAGYEYELPYETTLFASYGYTDSKGGSEDYNDWAVGVGKSLFGLDVTLTYTDTDISSADCEATYGKDDYCDSNLTVAVSKSF
ncbi:TorF family putative porin [Pseudomonas lopnurensis]|uniref:TorF family putative porin n=1 Tax=Pseudomonas lopnurensis TaxID=1477517 RepID=UPI0028B0561C|nr:TorF family putative porin [Pseudomonas lopnurensis]